MSEFMLAGFLMAVGMAVAGTGTYAYQMLVKQQAMLRFDGKTLLHSFAHLAVSFFCGPFIMLQMGWSQEKDGTLSISSALISAFVGFGWAFITGLLFVGGYVALT